MSETTYIVTHYDLMDSHYWGGGSDQVMLHALKKKGAPVKGMLFLTPNFTDCDWEMFKEGRDTIVKVKWRIE